MARRKTGNLSKQVLRLKVERRRRCGPRETKIRVAKKKVWKKATALECIRSKSNLMMVKDGND